MLWIKSLGWHMQWTPLPAEPSTHPSHFRNDPCEDLGLAQQKARRKLGEKKCRSIALGFTWDSPKSILVQATPLGLLGLQLVLGIQFLLQV